MLDEDIAAPAIELLGTAVGELMEDTLPVALRRSGSTQERQERARELRAAAEDIEVLTAENGYQCLDICSKTPVDVVLLESVDGRPHLAQVAPVLKARKAVFVDKPLAHVRAKKASASGYQNSL